MTSLSSEFRRPSSRRSLPFIGLPALTVSTGIIESKPFGVQLVANRFREDVCLEAAEVIERGGTPPAPIDPAW